MMHSLIKQTFNRARPITLGLFHHRLPHNSSLSFKSSTRDLPLAVNKMIENAMIDMANTRYIKLCAKDKQQNSNQSTTSSITKNEYVRAMFLRGLYVWEQMAGARKITPLSVGDDWGTIADTMDREWYLYDKAFFETEVRAAFARAYAQKSMGVSSLQDVKDIAVMWVHLSGRPVAHVAADLYISEAPLYGWWQEYIKTDNYLESEQEYQACTEIVKELYDKHQKKIDEEQMAHISESLIQVKEDGRYDCNQSEDAKFEKIKFVFLNIADFYFSEAENPQARSNALNLKKSIESIHNETDLVSLVTQSYPLKPWEDIRDTIVYLDIFLDRSRVVEQLFKILQKPRQAGLPLVFPEKLITDYIQVLRSSYDNITEENDLQSGWPQELNRIYGTTYPTDEQIKQYIIKDLYNHLEIFGGYKEKLNSMAEYVHKYHQKTMKPLPDDTPSLKF